MIKIVNWNIRHGLGMDGTVDIRRIGEELKTFDADIYTIQEIDRGAERSGYEDQAEILAEILGCEFHFTHISRVPEGTYGLATFSKLKMVNKDGMFLSRNVENNSAQLTRFHLKQSVFDVVNLHAPWKNNTTYWKTFLGEYNLDECILTGDFNLSPLSTIIKNFRSKYNWKNEQLTTANGKLIDHTFVPFKVLSQEVHKTNLSDHHILVTTFDLW